ncbi:hypothetical protein MCHIJ_31440 [Mycolicibacterium chitae]|uniref:Conserved membrane protein of uncharacterized function n=1 Tax=Mycolicibacterium chitae TaxID=1792 RepID=A0A448I4Y7_MYCCI|nr:hypothetical protein [Mycolicibacterium chitae]MCV7106540.1 hypothetical protein [Mycolicibacterium chitae]BBZ03707.1 hypothetical protein MCHIJ_31440 [Mycolicibacterium chitae]VEG47362.1 Conserved membrane protein of uncharacterised function [Mycolicibacterium chitae]
MDGFLSWWDGVELWLSGLDFVLQTLVVMPVVLALAYGIALLLDAALGNTIRVSNRLTAAVRGGRQADGDGK